MDDFKTIVIDSKGKVVTLWLARPEIHNALDDIMIHELSAFFSEIEKDSEIRVIVIKGQGKSFCSGADLKWMKRAIGLTGKENLKECEELSNMFRLIFNSNKIVIAAVHGNVFGGGNGLVAVSDLAYCVDNSKFSLSESRIGMAAVSITPYMLKKINASDLKELIFSARTFNGKEAVKFGLINQSFIAQEEMDLYLNSFIEDIMANGKQALIESKRQINRLMEQSMAGEMVQIPGLLARIRVSPEAQEGFLAFLGKRKSQW